MQNLPYLKDLEKSHPIYIYIEENIFLKSLLIDLSKTNVYSDPQLAYNIFNQIAQVDIRYTRKENQLFPYLEKRGWTGPSQGMWTFHDSNRQLIRDLRKKFENHDYTKITSDIHLLISELSRMILVEESRLFPTALALLLDEDWQNMKAGESEIGWMHLNQSSEQQKKSKLDTIQKIPDENEIRLSEGAMTREQIDLMLQFIPFDLTFVDENDRVKFYNRGEDRVFPRSAGVIGREVRFCHPPKSVDTVLKILEKFKNGTQNTAEFWINYRGQIIHIRYFAVRDSLGTYKGVIEVSQDITKIKNITGEKRLLDWND